MLLNEYVSVTSIHRSYRTSYRRSCIFDDPRKVAHKVLCDLSEFCQERYGNKPYQSLQIISEGNVDTYTYYVTFPLVAHSYYIIRFVVTND